MAHSTSLGGWISQAPPQYTIRYNKDHSPYFVHKGADVAETLKVGAFSYFHGRIRVTGSQDLVVGSFCSIANDVTFHCGDNHQIKYLTSYPLNTILGLNTGMPCAVGDGVRVGSDVWVGEGARILPGSSIGSGVVIGAGTVVRGHIPPYAIAIGNPAAIIRYRFPPYVIDKLIDLQWWNWPMDKLRLNLNIFGIKLDTISEDEFLTLLSKIQ